MKTILSLLQLVFAISFITVCSPAGAQTRGVGRDRRRRRGCAAVG